jgi:plasmid stabilization system protein ParE
VSRTVRALRRAQADLQQIYNYAVRDTPRRADPLIESLLDAIESLATHAERGSRPRDQTLRKKGYRYLVHGHHLIFYKILPKHVQVHRVLHGKRAYRRLL